MVKKIYTFILIIYLILSGISINAKESLPAVDTSNMSDNTCIDRNTSPVEWEFAQSILTLGFADFVKSNFKMRDINALKNGTDGFAESKIVDKIEYTSDGRKVPTSEKVRLCQVPDNKISFCFSPKLLGPDCSKDIHTLELGKSANYGIFYFRAARIADQICVQTHFPTTGWINLGCKYSIPTSVSAIDGKFVNQGIVDSSCTNINNVVSKGILPLTSSVVQCFQSSVYNLFFKEGLVETFRSYMEVIVQSTLILFMIFTGMKIVIGAEQYRKQEFYFTIFKFMFVIYFTSRSGIEWLYISFIGAADSLSAMIYNAGGINALCDYSKISYPNGFSIIRTWDAIDCRLLYYLGLIKMDAKGLQDTISSLQNNGLVSLSWQIIKFSVSLLLTFNLVQAFMIIAISVFFISIIVHVLHTYIIAYFAISLVTYMAPIFVPMILFTHTKSYFDQWLKSLIGYTLQPMILVLFVALMVSVLDKAMFANCQFTEHSINARNTTIPFFTLNSVDDMQGINQTEKMKCRSSMGYRLSSLNGDAKETTLKFLFTRIPIVNFAGSMMDAASWGPVLGMMVLFYFIAPMIGGFATDLTGAATLSENAIGAQAFANKSMSVAWTGAKALANMAFAGSGLAMEKAKQTAQKALKNATEDDKNDDDNDGNQYSNRTNPGNSQNGDNSGNSDTGSSGSSTGGGSGGGGNTGGGSGSGNAST